ncbi:MAG: hypothetical protein QM302_01305 [Acidobacteriota bacterium]|nr:hypothetical protein [Acidobacteriota bacterium]
MPMKTSTKIVKILLTNVPIALSISAVASYMGISQAVAQGALSQGAFVPALAGSVAMNFVFSYAISFIVGWFVPAERWGFSFAGACGVTPADGIKFGLLLNLVVNLVYVVVNDLILTYVNAIVMQRQPLSSYLPAVLGSFVPCYVVGYIVSFLWAQNAERIARSLCHDEAGVS